MRETDHDTEQALYRDLWRYASVTIVWLVITALALALVWLVASRAIVI